MKEMIFITVLIGLVSHTLSAAEGEIKREFTVTQIAIDQQHTMMEEEESDENNTSADQSRSKGGATEN
jgi:hypothetical protein